MRALAIAIVAIGCGRIDFDPLDNGSVITGCPGARAVVGKEHTCAVRADGTLACWGDNGYGQLGDGTNTASLTPVEVVLPGTVAHAAAGAGNTCAQLRFIARAGHRNVAFRELFQQALGQRDVTLGFPFAEREQIARVRVRTECAAPDTADRSRDSCPASSNNAAIDAPTP